MADHSDDTLALRGWLDRIDAGDLAACDDLLRAFAHRLEKLARKMLRRFPRVQRWADTDDVLQNAALRLLRALQEVRPADTRAFFGLAAEEIRRELIDLGRHFYGPRGEGANHDSEAERVGGSPLNQEPARVDPDDLERWCAFHEHVACLPVAEREVVGLIFYHGWTQVQVAEFLQMGERTVRRHWEGALVKLRRMFEDQQSV